MILPKGKKGPNLSIRACSDFRLKSGESARPPAAQHCAGASHADDIAAAGLKSTKTGVTFSPSQPIPDGLIKKLALASRRDQNL